MKNSLLILFLFLTLNLQGQSVPNTETFSFTDVYGALGQEYYNLSDCFDNADISKFDSAYYPYYLMPSGGIGDYNRLSATNSQLNFRNYGGTLYGLSAPVATGAQNIGRRVFSLGWTYTIYAGGAGTEGFYLDISLYSDFHTTMAENYYVGNTSWETFSAFETNTVYYYRVRAKTLNGWSAYSNVSKFRTSTDWSLPSYAELYYIYQNLKLNSIGDLTDDMYWSSSELDYYQADCYPFSGEGVLYRNKDNNLTSVRAARTFITSYTYNVGDIIYEDPEDDLYIHGYIFYKVDNGDGTYTYYECSPTDQSTGYIWSNVWVAIGTTSQSLGTGVANTTAIIGQSGHTSSAAKLCRDYNSVIP
jgi:hypothetical protein